MHALNFFVLVMSEVGHVTIVSSLLTINLTLKKKDMDAVFVSVIFPRCRC